MTLIPEDKPATVEDLAVWFQKKAELAKLQATEILLRKRIFRSFFAAPKEGSNNHTLPDGFVLNGTHVVNRKIDEPIMLAMWEQFVAAGINMNELIRKKPELNKTAYNQLTAEQRHMFDQALTISDGSPQLEVKKPSSKTKTA